MRALSEKYADPAAALADGFVRDPHGLCVTGAMMGDPELGGMGVHYFRPDRLGLTSKEPPITGVDAEIAGEEPELLVYEPGPDGEVLVAVECLVFEDPWKAAGNEGPPTFNGQPFACMVDDPETEIDEAHAFAPHYELHVWTARENPAGMYAEFNPAVTGPAPERDHADHAEAGR